jgi:O-antigen/teichoic acid export membrane protein
MLTRPARSQALHEMVLPQSTAENIHAKARRGIKLLLVRQIFLQIFTFSGGVILARVLAPAQFGLFAIASFWVGILALVGDFGLAPSFIQRRSELTERDLQVGFTLQQIMTTVVVLVLLLGAPWVAALYSKAPRETEWLVRALAFSLYLTSWRSMSALQLERRLQYDRLAWIEVMEAVSYQGIAVGLALAGYGVWSLVCAVLARGLLGTILVYLAAPWRVCIGFDWEVAKGILGYGIPFQIQAITNQASGWITPILVASLIGPQAVGFLTWASSNGKKPLMLVDNVMRVAFPHLSRIQNDRAEVERTLIRYLTYLLLPAGLWLAVLLIAGPSLVKWVYTDKWLPAVPALLMFAAALGLDVVAWVVAVSLNSLGLVNFTTRVVLVRSLATITLSIPLVLILGYNGVPAAYLLASSLSVPWLFMGLNKGSLRRVSASIIWIGIPVAVSVLISGLVVSLSLTVELRAVLAACTTSVVYVTIMFLVSPRWLRDSIMERVNGNHSL